MTVANTRTRPVDRYPWKWQRDADGWRLYSGTTKTTAKAMPCNSTKVKLALTAPIMRTRSEGGVIVFSGVRTGWPNVYCTALDGSLQRRNADDNDHDLITVMATHEWIERGAP